MGFFGGGGGGGGGGFGMADQQFALQWVQANAAAFGAPLPLPQTVQTRDSSLRLLAGAAAAPKLEVWTTAAHQAGTRRR